MCRKTLFICFLISISGILILNANFAKDVTAKALTYSEMNSKFGGSINLGWDNKYTCESVPYSTFICQQPPNNYVCVGVYYNICVWNGNPASNCYTYEHEQPICGGPDPECLNDYTNLDCM